MKLAELTVNQFLNKLMSNEPVPGGGSIAALNAAIAASLTGMVAGLTIGRKKYANVEEDMQHILKRMEELRNRFAEDIDHDSVAYAKVMEAYKLPKDTPEQQEIRNNEIQKAMQVAAIVPLAVARHATQMLPLIMEVASRGNQNAVTDACVAMLCCRTAIVGAIMNVRINLQSIEDTNFVNELETEVAEMEEKAWDYEKRMLIDIKGECGL